MQVVFTLNCRKWLLDGMSRTASQAMSVQSPMPTLGLMPWSPVWKSARWGLTIVRVAPALPDCAKIRRKAPNDVPRLTSPVAQLTWRVRPKRIRHAHSSCAAGSGEHGNRHKSATRNEAVLAFAQGDVRWMDEGRDSCLGAMSAPPPAAGRRPPEAGHCCWPHPKAWAGASNATCKPWNGRFVHRESRISALTYPAAVQPLTPRQ